MKTTQERDVIPGEKMREEITRALQLATPRELRLAHTFVTGLIKNKGDKPEPKQEIGDPSVIEDGETLELIKSGNADMLLIL